MKFSIIFFLTLILFPAYGNQKVFIIHAYASPRFVMYKINKSLKKENYTTENYRYKSMYVGLDSLGGQLYNTIKASKLDTVSFVTHSMGALVLRSMLQHSDTDTNFPVIHRVVMIAPPNKGAEVADYLAAKPKLRKILGPNMKRMTTHSNSYVNQLPKPKYSEVGIIVGIRGKKNGYNPFIKGDDDGILSIDKVKLDMNEDLVFIKNDHLFITQEKSVSQLIVNFLNTGIFISKE